MGEQLPSSNDAKVAVADAAFINFFAGADQDCRTVLLLSCHAERPCLIRLHTTSIDPNLHTSKPNPGPIHAPSLHRQLSTPHACRPRLPRISEIGEQLAGHGTCLTPSRFSYKEQVLTHCLTRHKVVSTVCDRVSTHLGNSDSSSTGRTTHSCPSLGGFPI